MKPKGLILLGIVLFVIGYSINFTNNGSTMWYLNAGKFIIGFWILGSICFGLGISLRIKNAWRSKQ